MKFLIFKKEAQKLGFTVRINKTEFDRQNEQFNRVYVILENEITSIDIAKILEFENEVIWFVSGNVRSTRIADLIEKFNSTPINERGYDEVETTLNELDKAIIIVKSNDISVSEIASKTGVNRQSINSLRNGKINMEDSKWINVHRIAKMYDEMKK